MAITPQSIKDAEFQVKLRGFDKSEVRTYLEYVAEEYLVLLEKLERLERYGQNLDQANKKIKHENKVYKNEIVEAQNEINELKVQYQQEKKRTEKQDQESETTGNTLSQLEKENRILAKKLRLADARIKETKSTLVQEKTKKEKLLQRINFLEKQNKSNRKEEEELRQTLAAAYKFSEETIQKSEEQASDIFNRARLEIERLRSEAQEELASYPREIKRMKQEYDKVKEQLRLIVGQYLKGLESESIDEIRVDENEQEDSDQDIDHIEDESEETSLLESNEMNNKEYRHDEAAEDQHELFQSIPIPEDMPPTSDYLDELTKNINLSLDSED